MMPRLPSCSFLLLLLWLAGCKEVPLLPSVTPYRMDIQQGNVVTQDQVRKLEPGMTRAQVRFLLGTPLIVDPFRTDRWDYVYLYKKGGQPAEQRRLIVIFSDDKFARIEGDPMPPGPSAGNAEAGKPAAGAAAAGEKPAQPPPARTEEGGEGGTKTAPQGEERGFFGRIFEKLGF